MSNANSISMKLYLMIVLFLFLTPKIFGQENKPLNSNYLIEKGVSPRILDAAASALLQDGSFIKNVNVISEKNGESKSFDYQIIYDPEFKYGMDIRAVVDSKNVNKEDRKFLTNLIERSHSFSRMSRNYLYDESSLKVINDDEDELVLEFYYQKKDIDPYLKEIKRLKGTIFFKNGELDKVVLVNIKPMRSKISSFERTVKFEKIKERGGHIVSSIIEKVVQNTKDGVIDYTINSNIILFVDDNDQNIDWENKQSTTAFFENKETDTISVKLGWVLPIWGKPATKLGYNLPRPIGLNAFMHFQSQTMQFTGLSLAMNDEELVPFDGLFDINNSSISATTSVNAAKADVWIFPFMNIMAIAGYGRNDIYGNWPLNENFKQELADYGWLIDVAPENIPNEITLRGNLESVLYGAGTTLAGGIGDWNFTLSYQFLINEVTEANTTSVAQVIMPMIGYMTPFGLNLMVGGQGQFYDTKVKGFVTLDDGQTLNYNVDFEPIRWNAMFGIYKGFAKHWEIALQGGFGKRNSLTTVFGYRF